ncbi:MAG: type II toxin-antitoxin system prevent-host-death family antitoxin [Deltaproteobacteria bacterium]|nr:type II toxin-antitoxin system prevent-host-death family antitoxin [Deltaproteobacteria bacterium]
MPSIIPISDLRNKTHEVLELCREGEPVFVTRNGQGELVVMSQSLFEQMQARLELYQALEEAESFRRKGHKGRPHAEVIQKLRSRP